MNSLSRLIDYYLIFEFKKSNISFIENIKLNAIQMRLIQSLSCERASEEDINYVKF